MKNSGPRPVPVGAENNLNRKMNLLQVMESTPPGPARRHLASILLNRAHQEPRRFVRFRRRFGGREDTLARWRWMSGKPSGFNDRRHRFWGRMVDEMDGKITTRAKAAK